MQVVTRCDDGVEAMRLTRWWVCGVSIELCPRTPDLGETHAQTSRKFVITLVTMFDREMEGRY